MFSAKTIQLIVDAAALLCSILPYTANNVDLSNLSDLRQRNDNEMLITFVNAKSVLRT